LLPERKAPAEPGAKSRLRHLNEHLFTSLRHARHLIAAWRDDYNHHRPHTSLDGLTPREFLNRSVKDQTLKRANF
jgi:putative transposase